MVMVDGSLDAEKIAGYFKGKSILITGATGFLGKILVEKILRVQPDVRRIYLLVRAMDAHSAKQRVEAEVTDTELFCLLKEKHGKGGFELFVEEKVVPLAGDVVFENMGLDAPRLEELANEVDIIVNGAATTNFYERYDIALDVNVMGVKYLCQFAKKCANLKMLLHVSTAFAAGDREGLIMERPFKKGETLREGTYLDIDAELRLAGDVKKELERQGGGGG
uniref:Fatty acyl-CoA reductase n=1 Tax=Triticum urartu TaxID=4572 RepID=A0A8R7RFN4_TRIUA